MSPASHGDAATPGRRRIVVCADDFGFSAEASSAILALGRSGAISATSVAVDGPAIDAHLGALRGLRPQLAVGLHLNFTENPHFAGPRDVRGWILATWLRRGLDRGALAREIIRQLDRFETLFGTAPDFVDGHEHVHQFPLLRELLLDALVARHGRRVAVRCTWPRHYRGAKAALIGLLGARALRAALQRRGLACNSDFAGVYDLRAASGYGARMAGWLRTLDDGGLVMCHPEAAGGRSSPARRHEHDFLGSAAWPRLLQGWNIDLVRFGAA